MAVLYTVSIQIGSQSLYFTGRDIDHFHAVQGVAN